MKLSEIRRRINIKYFMVGYLGLLFVFSSFYAPGRAWAHLLTGISIILWYSLFDLAWTRFGCGGWYLPVSSWISGLVLSVVALASPSVLQVIALPFLAVLSKHLFHFGKSRHVWNPAAFAMLVLSLFTPAVSWWALSWGMFPLILVSLVGLFILWRLDRWDVTLPFLGSFALCLALIYGPSSIGSFLFSSPVIFFATVMLVEPVTSSFPTRRDRLVYGTLTGLFAAGFSFVARFFTQALIDPLIAGLLLGNLTASLLFLPSIKSASNPNIAKQV
jgi:hypothetical protein